MIYGVDVSNHQAQFDFAGWDFAFIKSSEGTGFKDGRFTQHIANARAAGCIVAAYHYVRGGDVQGQFDNIRGMVPTDIPVILDVEDGAGSIDSIKQLAAKLRVAGYSVPLTYFPRWYWNKIGQPDLSGLAPLWLSWYPDYNARPREQAFGMVPASGKQPFGGIASAPVIQFTSTPYDQNAFDGTRDQLAALLGSRHEEDDLSAEAERQIGVIHDFVAVSAKAPNGQTVHDAVWAVQRVVEQGNAGVLAAVAETTSDSDITLERLQGVIATAVTQANDATLVQVAQVVRDGLGQDNADLAKDIVTRIGTALGGGRTNGGL